MPSSITTAMEQPLTSTGVSLPHSDAHMAVGQLPTGTSNIAVQGGGSGLEGVGSELPGVDGAVAGGVVVGGNDQQILRQHELALQRLEELQSDMIGGEKGGRPLDHCHSRTVSQ